MEMSVETEKLLVSLLHSFAGRRDVSISWIASDVFKDIAKCIQGVTLADCTPMKVAHKVQTLIDKYNNFIWFLTKPGIIYLPEHNMVVTHSLYHTRCAATESEEHRTFREKGCPYYQEFKDMVENKHLDRVDFGWVYTEMETTDKKILGKPSESLAW